MTINKKIKTNVQRMEPDDIDVVIYHNPCADGTGSAWAAWRYLSKKFPDRQVEYVPTTYGKKPPDVTDKNVLICDFSYRKNVLLDMIKSANQLLILDHHKTAKDALSKVPKKYVTFDMNHSGAFITWVYMYVFEYVPSAVLYVEDNDIWNKVLPLTKEFTSCMFSKEFDFDEYEKFFNDKYLLTDVFPVGNGMTIQNDAYVQQLAKKAVPSFMMINKRYYFTACLDSAGILRSELGNYVLSYLNNSNFSMIYSHDHYKNYTSISLRSINDKTDSSEISRLSGGGGHRNASGMGLNYIVTNPPGRLIDNHRAYWLLENIYSRDIKGKKFLFLNCPNLQKHMAYYLMQERYFGDEKESRNKERYEANLPGYQEGMFCMRNLTNNNSLDEYYHGAIVWAYDGHTNTIFAKLKFIPELYSTVTTNAEQLNMMSKVTNTPICEVKTIGDSALELKYHGDASCIEPFINSLIT